MKSITTAGEPKQNPLSSPAAERILNALNLETIDLSAMPHETAEIIADICETKLRYYPFELQSILCCRTVCRNQYFRYFKWIIELDGKVSQRRAVKTMFHEFGHAFLCKVFQHQESKEKVMAQIESLYTDNLKELYNFFWSIEFTDRINAYVVQDSFINNNHKVDFLQRTYPPISI